MKDLSIAIVSWNTRELLDQCLDSVYKTTSGTDFEVIVVDNASSDGSADMVEEKYPRVRLVRSRVNVGFAAGCNLAFKHSTGRYFLLLNSDTIVLDNALAKMVKFMDRHRQAGAAGCRLLNSDGSLQRSCSCFPSLKTELLDALFLSKLFPDIPFFSSYSMSYWDFRDSRPVDFAGGSCLIVRREAIEEVGLLDESYFMYTEEADWCYRLWQHDWDVWFDAEASIIHLGGQSARKYGSDIQVQLYASRNKFIRKHHGRVASTLHKGIVVLGAVCRIPAFGLGSLIGKAPKEAVGFQFKLLDWAFRNKYVIKPASDAGAAE